MIEKDHPQSQPAEEIEPEIAVDRSEVGIAFAHCLFGGGTRRALAASPCPRHAARFCPGLFDSDQQARARSDYLLSVWEMRPCEPVKSCHGTSSRLVPMPR